MSFRLSSYLSGCFVSAVLCRLQFGLRERVHRREAEPLGLLGRHRHAVGVLFAHFTSVRLISTGLLSQQRQQNLSAKLQRQLRL